MPEAGARIAAKARLWDFINDTKEEWLNWQYTDEEMASQLVTVSLSILLPYFSILEIEKELRNLYGTIQKPLPAAFISIFSDSYMAFIKAKLPKAE